MANVNPTNGLPLLAAQAQVPSTVHQPNIIMMGAPNAAMQGTTPKIIQPTTISNIQNMNTHDSTAILTKARLNDLVRDADPTLTLDDEVEEALLAYTDDFVDCVLNSAAMIAKHRHANTIEVKDVQQLLNRNYGIWTPGFGTDELRPYKRTLAAESHKQRLALIRKALKKY